jgi:hypothetical protein
MVMKRARCWLAVGLIAAAPLVAQEPEQAKPPKPPKPAINFDKLKFMAGCWQGQLDRETVVEEIWTTPAENLLLATTRYLKKDRATSFEFSKIQAIDSTVVFAASSEGKPFDQYPLKQIVDDYVVFENLAKPFPQRIMYRLASDGALIPRNEGEGRTSIELRLKKVKCPGT